MGPLQHIMNSLPFSHTPSMAPIVGCLTPQVLLASVSCLAHRVCGAAQRSIAQQGSDEHRPDLIKISKDVFAITVGLPVGMHLMERGVKLFEEGRRMDGAISLVGGVATFATSVCAVLT